MFTGIIETKAKVLTVEKRGECLRMTVQKPSMWRIKKGASVAIDGICLTSVGAPGKNLVFDLMRETLSKTTAKDLTKGRIVNLERSLRAGAEIGGHFVQGHVDTRARVTSRVDRGNTMDITVQVPPKFTRYTAEIGSIAINGVSLTIARKKGKLITVSLIPRTSTHTNLGDLSAGDEVNVEFDMLAKYLAALR